MNGKHLIPFKGMNPSGPINQNLVWQNDRVFVMDCHRAALWCWAQVVDFDDRVNVFHIDRHNDCLRANLAEEVKNLPPLSGSIDAYLNAEMGRRNLQDFPWMVVRWDNYLSIFFEQFRKVIGEFYFATHKVGDKPNFEGRFIEPWDLIANFSFWLKQSKFPWIVNLDLDYFFVPHPNNDEQVVKLFDDEFILALFSEIAVAYQAGHIGALTICLTPDPGFTPGWEEGVKLTQELLGKLGMKIDL